MAAFFSGHDVTVYGIKTGGEAMDLGLGVPNPWVIRVFVCIAGLKRHRLWRPKRPSKAALLQMVFQPIRE